MRAGKTFWPHSLDVVFGIGDVEAIALRAIRWLRENGAKPPAEREDFVVSTMGEIVETDPDTGAPLKKGRRI